MLAKSESLPHPFVSLRPAAINDHRTDAATHRSHHAKVGVEDFESGPQVGSEPALRGDAGRVTFLLYPGSRSQQGEPRPFETRICPLRSIHSEELHVLAERPLVASTRRSFTC